MVRLFDMQGPRGQEGAFKWVWKARGLSGQVELMG